MKDIDTIALEIARRYVSDPQQLAKLQVDIIGTMRKQQVGEVQGAREQFEAWAKSAGLETKIYAHNDMHSHPVTRGAWMAWQHLAARPRLRQEPVSIKSVRQFIADRTPNEEYREDILSGDHDHSAWFDHIRELMTALSQGNNS